MKFHEEASIVIDYIPAYFYKLYREKVLAIFAPYYQDIAKEARQINVQFYYEDELKLNEVINNNVDLEQMLEEEKSLAKKQV